MMRNPLKRAEKNPVGPGGEMSLLGHDRASQATVAVGYRGVHSRFSCVGVSPSNIWRAAAAVLRLS